MSTIVHVGTPEILVMFCLEVTIAMVSILFSHSGFKAISIEGVLYTLDQKGKFFSKTADISPVYIPEFGEKGVIC